MYRPRQIDLKVFPPIKDRLVTLVAIHQKNAEANVFTTTVRGKRDIVEFPAGEYQLLAIWTGQYRSDVFEVDGTTLEAWKQQLRTAQISTTELK
jgi:hypothetical protein